MASNLFGHEMRWEHPTSAHQGRKLEAAKKVEIPQIFAFILYLIIFYPDIHKYTPILYQSMCTSNKGHMVNSQNVFILTEKSKRHSKDMNVMPLSYM